MVAASTVIPVLKYGFLTLVVSCAGYLIATITAFKHIHAESIDDLIVRHQISMQTEGAAGSLDRGFEKCLIRPFNVFCQKTSHKHFGRMRTPERTENGSTTSGPEHSKIHPVTKILRSFYQMARDLNVTPVILDPSHLFCLLNPQSKALLLENGFNPVRFKHHRNSIIMGIDEDGAKALNEYPKGRMTTLHFGTERNIAQLNIHMSPATLHVGVFYQKKGYLWRPSMSVPDSPMMVLSAAFENFTAVRIPSMLNMDIYVPSDPVFFLYQMETSFFFQCSLNNSEVQPHPTLTQEQLVNRAAVAIQELKTVFHSYFVRFWLWGESLHGFNLDCNIFGSVTDLSVAALNSTLEKLNLTEIFSGNEYLILNPEFSVVGNKLSKVTFDCHGLRVNMFIAHEEGESLRFYEDMYGNQDAEGWVYPRTPLLSTDVFGQIVYFPKDSHDFFSHVTYPMPEAQKGVAVQHKFNEAILLASILLCFGFVAFIDS